MKQLRAVLTDLFGVIRLGQEPDFPQRLGQLLRDCDPDLAYAAYWRFRLDYDRGALDDESYWRQVLACAGSEFTPELFAALRQLDAWSWRRESPEMIDFLYAMWRHYPLNLLSNLPTTLAREIEQRPWMEVFDHVTFSCEVHLVKPEAEIYRHAVALTPFDAAEILFIDDSDVNLEAAEKVGLQVIKYVDTSTIPQLRKRLALP